MVARPKKAVSGKKTGGKYLVVRRTGAKKAAGLGGPAVGVEPALFRKRARAKKAASLKALAGVDAALGRVKKRSEELSTDINALLARL